ncbi:hypothetical protein G5V58_03255 [Nocardioides anomalus]|uniref:Uncharacterized protein n=1 Tax=Nocardioides anomalus TaxID=2712223 RepID=A0A6G6W9U7_9ACTN|nr:hypothetical protein [Nocardioides anomalus]QIG41927.1 hypothetical protein G5V58_03255 [Nocardioides anomalus]
MRRPLLTLAAAAAALVSLTAAPAHAESGHKDTTVGDAPAAIDITAIDATNAVRRVKIKVTVPGLTTAGTFTFGYEGRTYDGMAIDVRHRGSGASAKAFRCGEESCAKVACRGLQARWDVAGHVVSVSVPQRCYPGPVPETWSINAHADLGKEYDSDGTRLRLRRG